MEDTFTLQFDLSDDVENMAFFTSVLNLNKSGVPYKVNQTGLVVIVEIGRGF